jgi:hypothetical protein
MSLESRIAPEACVRAVCAERYPEASVVFLAGSVMQGHGTRFSDLDLVVVHERLHHAYRESFIANGWPVEAFVHDPETLRYFFGTDRANGVPTLASMIVDGIALPAASDFARTIATAAAEALRAGPPSWAEKERQFSRYLISDLIEDLREPRSRAEFQASVSRLYEMLANHFCRSRGEWSARGKAIVRRLHEVDPSFALEFTRAFQSAFETADAESLFRVAQRTLEPDGGFLFAGYRAEAPEDWRIR